ncbi:hypothetical protein ACWEPL_53995 [Nonomuraea sp. NPDC004186]
MRAWLTSFNDRRNWIGGADPIEFQDLRSLSGSVVFSGMIPNSGHIRADREPGTDSSEPVSIVQLESPELSLKVYNPGYRGPGGAGSGATSAPLPESESDFRASRLYGPPIVAPIPLVWDYLPNNWYEVGDKFAMVVPPWLTNLRVAGFGKDDAAWQPLQVEDDGTTWVPIHRGVIDESAGCDDGVLQRADEKAFPDGTTRQVTYLYRPGFPYPVKLLLMNSTGSSMANGRLAIAAVVEEWDGPVWALAVVGALLAGAVLALSAVDGSDRPQVLMTGTDRVGLEFLSCSDADCTDTRSAS